MKHNFKSLLFSLIIFCGIAINSVAAELELKQSSDGPDIETTQKWIKEKVENDGQDLYYEYSNVFEDYLSLRVFYNYDGCTATVTHVHDGRNISDTPLSISLDYRKMLDPKIQDSNMARGKGVYLYPMANFSDQDLAIRVKKAMDHLRKLCGAKIEPVKEEPF